MQPLKTVCLISKLKCVLKIIDSKTAIISAQKSGQVFIGFYSSQTGSKLSFSEANNDIRRWNVLSAKNK